jgi:hypothetical protein
MKAKALIDLHLQKADMVVQQTVAVKHVGTLPARIKHGFQIPSRSGQSELLSPLIVGNSTKEVTGKVNMRTQRTSLLFLYFLVS